MGLFGSGRDSDRREARPASIRTPDGPELLDRVRGEATAVIYKHSPSCGLSSRALRAVTSFASGHPDTPVYMVDVIGQRALARAIATELDIRHESPQVIVFRDGEPVWHTSHFRITERALAEAVTGGDA